MNVVQNSLCVAELFTPFNCHILQVFDIFSRVIIGNLTLFLKLFSQLKEYLSSTSMIYEFA
jgi:hypothetical protein